jgi:hypothetical protein
MGISQHIQLFAFFNTFSTLLKKENTPTTCLMSHGGDFLNNDYLCLEA